MDIFQLGYPPWNNTLRSRFADPCYYVRFALGALLFRSCAKTKLNSIKNPPIHAKNASKKIMRNYGTVRR